MQETASVLDVHRDTVVLEHAGPPVAKSDELEAVNDDPLPHDRADHRVEPGAIAAAGQDSDTHCRGQ